MIAKRPSNFDSSEPVSRRAWRIAHIGGSSSVGDEIPDMVVSKLRVQQRELG